MEQKNKLIILNKKDIENIIIQNYHLNTSDIVNIDLNDNECIIELLDKTYFPDHYLNKKTMHYLPYTKNWYLQWIELQYPASTYNLFKQLDIPFIREEYYYVITAAMKNTKMYDIKQLDKKFVIGKYISKMYLHDFLSYSFEDTFKWEPEDYCRPIESIEIIWKYNQIDINIV